MSKHDVALRILSRHLNGARETLDAVKSEMDLQQSRMNYDTAMEKPEDPGQRAAYDKAAKDLPVVQAKVDSLKTSIDVLLRDKGAAQ